jgi:hypothetical protein
MPPQNRYRCRRCGRVLHAWLPVLGEPDGARLLQHLSQAHPGEVGAYVARMQTDEDITPVVLEAFEGVADHP